MVVVYYRYVAVVKHHLAALSANRQIWGFLRRWSIFDSAASRLVDHVELKQFTLVLLRVRRHQAALRCFLAQCWCHCSFYGGFVCAIFELRTLNLGEKRLYRDLSFRQVEA